MTPLLQMLKAQHSPPTYSANYHSLGLPLSCTKDPRLQLHNMISLNSFPATRPQNLEIISNEPLKNSKQTHQVGDYRLTLSYLVPGYGLPCL